LEVCFNKDDCNLNKSDFKREVINMLSFLIVDDNETKVKRIISTIREFPEIINCEIDTASDGIDARRLMQEKHYDLLILDLSLPERFGDDPKKDGGISLLNELNKSIAILKPFHIIGLTAYKELKEEFYQQFNEELWVIIHYDEINYEWKKPLKNKIKYLIQSKRELGISPVAYNYDLAIITALPEPELTSILRLKANWEKFKFPNDATYYYEGVFANTNKRLKVVAATSHQMGMTSSAILSMKLIENFRPKYLVMTGIAAGVHGISNIGDILISDLSWDYGSGKVSCDEKGRVSFLPDPKSIPLDIYLKEAFLEVKTSRKFLDDIRNKWPGEKPANSLELRVGPFASGAAVIENYKLIDEMKTHNRKLVGIDMETYGVFYAALNCRKPHPIPAAIKAVSDFADFKKDDDYQSYAAYVSAQFCYEFALEKF
jgi:nucleoside phosphorylase/CheY-like chemotaxis protein